MQSVHLYVIYAVIALCIIGIIVLFILENRPGPKLQVGPVTARRAGSSISVEYDKDKTLDIYSGETLLAKLGRENDPKLEVKSDIYSDGVVSSKYLVAEEALTASNINCNTQGLFGTDVGVGGSVDVGKDITVAGTIRSAVIETSDLKLNNSFIPKEIRSEGDIATDGNLVVMQDSIVVGNSVVGKYLSVQNIKIPKSGLIYFQDAVQGLNYGNSMSFQQNDTNTTLVNITSRYGVITMAQPLKANEIVSFDIRNTLSQTTGGGHMLIVTPILSDDFTILNDPTDPGVVVNVRSQSPLVFRMNVTNLANKDRTVPIRLQYFLIMTVPYPA